MALETFHAVHGQLVFSTQNQANQAQNAIESFLDRPAFKDASEQTVFQVPAGKYGAGPTVIVSVRFANLTDADAAWAAAESRWGSTQAGSRLWQVSVSQDTVTGEAQPAVIVHELAK